MPTQIDVDVTIGKTVSYKSSDPQVLPDGTITIVAGEDAVITFAPATGQTWQFNTPGISVTGPGADVTIVSQSASAVTIQDNYPKSGAAGTYTYTLYTSAGTLDPRLINRG